MILLNHLVIWFLWFIIALALLDDIIILAREKMYNKKDMDNDKEVKENVDSPSTSNGKSSSRSYPAKVPSPTSVLPKLSVDKSAKACSKVTFFLPVLLTRCGIFDLFTSEWVDSGYYLFYFVS